jgi:hypothetical protein
MVHAILGDPATAHGHPFLANGRVVSVQARPYRVVRETGDLTALLQTEGTAIPRWHIDERRLLSEPGRIQGHSLRLLYPGKLYDITLFFEANGDLPWFYDALYGEAGVAPGWRQKRRSNPHIEATPSRRLGAGTFRGWYVNVQEPVRRTPVGFDVVDLTLDIVVRPDLSWYWKDEDELALALSRGGLSEAFAAQIRHAGEEVVELIESRQSPFNGEWAPLPGISHAPITDIADGWQHLPAFYGE